MTTRKVNSSSFMVHGKENKKSTNREPITNNSVMEELLASLSTAPASIERGQEVEGKVIAISGSEITVDLGLKSEGILPLREIQSGKEKIKPGDSIKVIIAEVENENGQIVLSIQKSGKQKTQVSGIDSKKWDELSEKLTREEIIKGKVTKVTQFGVFVQIQGGIEGLIHISKLKVDDKFEVGQAVNVSVDSIDKEKGRIALSPVRTSTKGLIYK